MIDGAQAKDAKGSKALNGVKAANDGIQRQAWGDAVAFNPACPSETMNILASTMLLD
jgi:hypothetical protein